MHRWLPVEFCVVFIIVSFIGLTLLTWHWEGCLVCINDHYSTVGDVTFRFNQIDYPKG